MLVFDCQKKLSIIKQFSDQVQIRLISQLINDIQKVLQKIT